MKGGYQIVDLNGADLALSSEEKLKEGIKQSKGKPILIVNSVATGGQKVFPFFANVVDTGTDYVLSFIDSEGLHTLTLSKD